jgi:hypothetical protein
MERLLSEQGDCVFPVPISQPAPVPVPPTPPVPPAPADIDVAYWQKIHAWANARHVGGNRAAALAAQDWAKAHGFYA